MAKLYYTAVQLQKLKKATINYLFQVFTYSSSIIYFCLCASQHILL